MQKIIVHSGYAYYVGIDEKGKRFYNIVPENQPAPKGGYYNKRHILSIKKVADLFD